MRSFFPGKKNSGHVGGGNPPSIRMKQPATGVGAGEVQASGQFGKPSGKTVASPLSRLNGIVKGAGAGKPNSAIPGGSAKGYGKVRVR